MTLCSDCSALDLRLTHSATDRLMPPDEERAWSLLNWVPVPMPGPGGQLAVVSLCLWAAPKVRRIDG